MKTWIKLLVMLCTVTAFAQDYTVVGKISSVNKDGLHLIAIPHTVRAYSSSNLSDFRIKDAKGNQVPYYVQPETLYTKTTVSNFAVYDIISRTQVADTSSTYIFKNTDNDIKQAVLSIANYQGSKYYKLSGSYDNKQWFGIVNNGQLQNLNHPKETGVYKVIDFPLCSYPFLKLVFDDRGSLPINLLKIGKATAESISLVPETMTLLPVNNVAFSDLKNSTQIHINFERPETVNQIKLDISAPELYSRKATLYTLQEHEANRKIETYRKPITTFNIRSDAPLVFDIPDSRESDLYLEIENKDNPKLQISEIQIFQKPIYIVANLKATQHYTITAGNDMLKAPDYDIKEVAHTVKRILPMAKIEAVTFVKLENVVEKTKSIWQQPWFMWCCIGLAALIILYYAFNLIKELNSSEK